MQDRIISIFRLTTLSFFVASSLQSCSTNRIQKARLNYLIEQIPQKYSLSDKGRSEVYSSFVDSLERADHAFSTRDYSHIAMTGSGIISGAFVKVPDLPKLSEEALMDNFFTSEASWNSAPWSENYSERIYREYVLPYRIDTEQLDPMWRSQAYYDYSPLLYESNPLSQCKKIERQLLFSIYSIFRDTARNSYKHYSTYKRGCCDDQCVYTAMIMRSVGLPVSIDIIPSWGDVNLGHSFNSLILPDESSIGFNSIDDLEHGIDFTYKVPKIYRKGFSIQKKSVFFRYRDSEYIPNLFNDFNLFDVTSDYGIQTVDFSIHKANRSKNRIAYLAVPCRDLWNIVAYGARKGRHYKFSNIGTGYHNHETQEKGENIGDGIVYLPLTLDNVGKQYPVTYPVILSRNDEPHYLIPDTLRKRTIYLSRKYPKLERIRNFARELELCVIEGANSRDFSDAVRLHTIVTQLESHLQTISIDCPQAFSYYRIRKRSGGLSIGELGFIDSAGERISGDWIASTFIESEKSIANVFDQNILTYFSCPGGFNDLWIGLDCKHPISISGFSISPRTDDNDVCPGDLYELFYWDNEWKSLGRQIATDFCLIYENVPDNALLYLKDLTKGIEERPFTYETKQIWW